MDLDQQQETTNKYKRNNCHYRAGSDTRTVTATTEQDLKQEMKLLLQSRIWNNNLHRKGSQNTQSCRQYRSKSTNTSKSEKRREEIRDTRIYRGSAQKRAYIHVEPFKKGSLHYMECLQSRRTQTKPQYNPENPLRNLINYYNSRSDPQNPRSTICKDVDHKNTHNSV